MALKTYQLQSHKLGCIVKGLDLNQSISPKTISHLIEDVTQHRLLIFKNQGIVNADRQLEISSWFGQIESTFYNHPKSPHRDIFRVSNDPSEGCTNVGRTGWHIDGSFQEKPFSHSIYHIISCPSQGATVFAPLTELIERLDESKRKFWDRLYMGSDRRGNCVHPHVYPHPLTKLPTLCFHLGMTDHYILDYGTPQAKRMNDEETEEIKAGIHAEFVKNSGDIQYVHEWQPGDFLISDNLALGHEASPDTQLSTSQVGLRVMHRVTIAGKHKPQK